MSRSPIGSETVPQAGYQDAWQQLAQRIQYGQSFSGRERNCCFLNTGGERFADVSAVVGLDHLDDSRAVAIVDWDHDGDLDLWQTNRTSPRVRFLQNDLPAENQFLSVRLIGDPGRGCARDAIGARVELWLISGESTPVKLIRTLSAGDGFLSQSSKWLHFGISPESKIDRIVVRWPTGHGADEQVEAWSALEPNRQYRLRQGRSEAEPLPRRDPVRMAASKFRPREEPAGGRLWLAFPTKFESQFYQPFASASPREITLDDRHLLIAFWASWCAPCIDELRELRGMVNELQQLEVDVLALSVEQLADGNQGNTESARQLAEAMQLPFATGLATRELIEHLDALRRAATYRQDQLPIPVSFLIDAHGRLRAVYTGTLSRQQLLEDASVLSTDDPDVDLARAVPFPGRWATSQFVTNPLAVAGVYRQQRQYDDAREYLQRYLNREPVPDPSDTSQEAMAARRRLADVHHMLGRIALDERQPELAMTSLLQARALYPHHVAALLDLGDLYLQSKKLAEATDVLEAGMELADQDPRIPHKLGLARLEQGRFADAIRLFETSLNRNSRYLPATNNLAWLLATCPESKCRDGARAVRLAEGLVERVGRRAEFLDTLAAAYAETGQYQRAVETAEAALRSIDTLGEAARAGRVEARLRLYRQGRPFHQSPAGDAPSNEDRPSRTRRLGQQSEIPCIVPGDRLGCFYNSLDTYVEFA